jgi:hypothetical protein
MPADSEAIIVPGSLPGGLDLGSALIVFIEVPVVLTSARRKRKLVALLQSNFSRNHPTSYVEPELNWKSFIVIRTLIGERTSDNKDFRIDPFQRDDSRYVPSIRTCENRNLM